MDYLIAASITVATGSFNLAALKYVDGDLIKHKQDRGYANKKSSNKLKQEIPYDQSVIHGWHMKLAVLATLYAVAYGFIASFAYWQLGERMESNLIHITISLMQVLCFFSSSRTQKDEPKQVSNSILLVLLISIWNFSIHLTTATHRSTSQINENIFFAIMDYTFTMNVTFLAMNRCIDINKWNQRYKVLMELIVIYWTGSHALQVVGYINLVFFGQPMIVDLIHSFFPQNRILDVSLKTLAFEIGTYSDSVIQIAMLSCLIFYLHRTVAVQKKQNRPDEFSNAIATITQDIKLNE